MSYSQQIVGTLAEIKSFSGLGQATMDLLGRDYPGNPGWARYVWDNASTATEDDDLVIKPTFISSGSPGRWVKDAFAVTQVNADWNASSGAAQILNKPSIASRAFNNAATKTLVTSATGSGGVQLNATRDVSASYWVDTSITTSIGGTSSVTAFLEIADTNSATAGDWTTISKASNGNTITLAIALQSVQPQALNVNGIIPAGKFVRIRYAVAGTASATYGGGQEITL